MFLRLCNKIVNRRNARCHLAWLPGHKLTKGHSAKSGDRPPETRLVIENIPNYQTPAGPCHPCVDEARENSFLKSYRQWVIDRSPTTSESELGDIKREVEEAIRLAQDEVFLRHLEPKTSYITAGKTALVTAVDVLIPGASLVASLGE